MDRSDDLKPNALFIFTVTEDAGSDQKAGRSRILAEVYNSDTEELKCDDYKHVWYWDVSCLVHQFNLIVGSQLASLDQCLTGLGKEYKYYSSLAKLIHTWRNIPKHIMSMFPPDHFAAHHLPPSPCAARWGCVHELEAFLLAIGPADVQEAFSKACVTATLFKGSSAKESSTQVVDDVAADEFKAFQERMNRYMRSASKSVKDSVFWFMMLTSFTAKEPLMHCYAWLQKPRPAAMLELVTGKAYGFLQELQRLIHDLSWVEYCLRESGCVNAVTSEVQDVLRSMALKIAVHNASAYERRFYSYICASLGFI